MVIPNRREVPNVDSTELKRSGATSYAGQKATDRLAARHLGLGHPPGPAHSGSRGHHGAHRFTDVPERLSRHINGVTWITGLAIVAGLALVGQGRWSWETAIAVGALFAANGFNRRQHGLRGAKAALGLALLVDLIGLAGAFGVPVPAAEFAYVVLLWHVLWHLVQPAYAEE